MRTAMTKHTPGPWEQYSNVIVKFGEIGGAVCLVAEPECTTTGDVTPINWMRSKRRDEASANARLIIAAPDMLEACKLALKRLERLGAEDDMDTAGPCPACEAIRTVLAKIEGK